MMWSVTQTSLHLHLHLHPSDLLWHEQRVHEVDVLKGWATRTSRVYFESSQWNADIVFKGFFNIMPMRPAVCAIWRTHKPPERLLTRITNTTHIMQCCLPVCKLSSGINSTHTHIHTPPLLSRLDSCLCIHLLGPKHSGKLIYLVCRLFFYAVFH